MKEKEPISDIKVSAEFAKATQQLLGMVDHVINNDHIFSDQQAGFIVAVTLPDPKDPEMPRAVAMLSQPAHPEMVEGMINKFFKRSTYGVYPVENT